MAEFSGFFDANVVNGEYDRVYLSEHFAKYFANFIGNGIFGGKSSELIVMQNEQPDMGVRVMPGFGYINGYFYENDDNLSLHIEVADGILDRIDAVVLRLNKVDRTIRLAVKKGVASSSPVVPSVERNDDLYELQLAQIYVKAGATAISQSNIIDKRLDSNVCGLVVAVIDQLDTADFAAQLEAWIKEFKLESTAEIEVLIERLREVIGEGAVGVLINDVDRLKSLAIESAEYPGCFYRIVNGETEWVNPPDEYGIEYRLTERFEGKPVYRATLYVAALSNNSFMNIRFNFDVAKVLSVDGLAYNESTYPTTHPFPVYAEGSVTPSAIFQSIGKDSVGNGISIRTIGDMRSYKASVTIKYTKS